MSFEHIGLQRTDAKVDEELSHLRAKVRELEASLLKIRAKALEDAARLVEEHRSGMDVLWSVPVAAAIRALIKEGVK